jgi:hypothetical protein
MMARNARTVNAVISFLRRPLLEDNASVEAFPRSISVVLGDIQNHPFIGNDRNAFSSLLVSLVVLLARHQTAPARPFPPGFGMKPTFHQFHAKLSQECRVIKSFWSLEPECLKKRKQVLVSNGVP